MNTYKIQGASFLSLPCERCGSKKKIAREWKERVETFNSFVMVTHQQIICTNKGCQLAFDENLARENKKRDLLRIQKEEADKKRQASVMLETKKQPKMTKSVKSVGKKTEKVKATKKTKVSPKKKK